eukprot:scaffold64957_cov60-Phaeocystis_antarctica.AAC.2
MALEPKNECTRASLSKTLASIAFPCKFACEIRRGRRAPREPASQEKRGGPRAPRVEFTRASWSKCARPPHEAHVSNSKDGARGKQQPTSLLRRRPRVDLKVHVRRVLMARVGGGCGRHVARLAHVA